VKSLGIQTFNSCPRPSLTSNTIIKEMLEGTYTMERKQKQYHRQKAVTKQNGAEIQSGKKDKEKGLSSHCLVCIDAAMAWDGMSDGATH